MRLRRLLPLALIAALLVLPAAAAGWQEAPHSRARLIAAGTANADALAGRTHLRTPAQLVGLEIELDPGWKTYWRSPGDGIPPQFEWAGSDNVAAAQVLWPVPTHFRDAAGEYNGYADRVVLPVVVAPKRPGAPVSLDLALDYAVCKDVCIPVSAQLSLRLPDDTPRGRQAVLEALRQVPVRADSRGRCGDLALADARLRFDGPSPRMEITLTHPPGGAPEDLFVEAATGQFMPHPKRQEATAERTVFHLDPSAGGDPRELAGKAMTLTVVAAPQSCEMTATME
ncbi:protein-disulfide reductase DsbD domain-containing protein [Dichotomicrobium thermohalophilum]|uniref:DsbC/DsbD-like thiol-disulfide interchange protein n=1 Tax=Dichotomicrobium thermohalophilum TaxID=933063 RepID=A0A397QA49_9HYPH|nr:protein-disulfide reductase DsbD domain-containing protein [Dichotomicrobium thermohalophilum]RIA56387.1 DsbC/DsbD-like thiol-disulfide interchange protein [Dichotomicrobium thermohalophilum]